MLSFAADANLAGLDRRRTPAASVHHAKAVVIRGIVDDGLLGRRHLRGGQFYDWNRRGRLRSLFGNGLFDDDDAYVRSASASHRYSYELPENDEFAGQLVEHVGASLTNLGILHPERHVIGGTTLLLSKRGAPRQSWHTDYKWWNRIFTSKGLVPGCHCVPYPVSVLIALHEEGAWLRVRDGEDIFVPQYGAVVFRGDLTHAGAEWTGASFNWRIHLYYDTQGTSWTSWSCKVPRVGREARGGRHIQVIKPPARAERAAAAA